MKFVRLVPNVLVSGLVEPNPNPVPVPSPVPKPVRLETPVVPTPDVPTVPRTLARPPVVAECVGNVYDDATGATLSPRV